MNILTFDNLFTPTGTLYKSRHCAETLLCADAAQRHLSSVFRRQLQRHLEEIPKHGSTGLRLPLNLPDRKAPSGLLANCAGFFLMDIYFFLKKEKKRKPKS